MICLLAQAAGCTKEIPADQDQHDSFLKIFELSSSNYLAHASELPNGDIVSIAGDEDNGNIYVLKHDQYGHLLSQERLTNSIITTMQGTVLSDGSVIYTNYYSSFIAKVDNTGKVVFDLEPFGPSNGVMKYSKAVESDSFYVYSSSDGAGTVWPSDSRLIQLYKDGSGGYFYYIEDEYMGGKLLTLRVQRVHNDTTWAVGHMYAGGFRSWKDKRVLYASKFHPGMDSFEVNMIDSSIYRREWLNGSATDADGNMYCLTTHGYGSNTGDGLMLDFTKLLRITKINSQLQKVWSKEIPLDLTKFAALGMELTPDGSLLVTGFCITSQSPNVRPILVKVDQNGNKLFQKIYNLNGTSGLFSATVTRDQSLLLSGYNFGFGTDQARSSALLIKTDRLGNLE